MTIHPVRLNGLVIGVPQTFYYFERIQERILQFVTANSHVKREAFTKLMLQTGELAADVGSVIYGEEAVELGLIDRIGGLGDAVAEVLMGKVSCAFKKIGVQDRFGQSGKAKEVLREYGLTAPQIAESIREVL